MPPIFPKILRIVAIVLWAALLTVLTQVGGVAYLVARLSSGWIRKRISAGWKQRMARAGYGIGIYLILCWGIVPILARPFGRVPLPVFGESSLGPLRWYTVLLNRHYVRPELKEAVLSVAEELGDRYPGTKLCYLDANFPFLDGFPLAPHLSHDDGKKLDLAFLYVDPETQVMLTGSPSWLGYGVCEGPQPGEQDQPRVCEDQGHWQYSFLQSILPH